MKHKVFSTLLMATLLSIPVWAQEKANKADKATKEAPKSKDGKVDISDLENKYWAPKDTDFSVVQNRTYTKANRFSLAVMGSRLVNDTYSEGTGLSVTGNYYFSERYGVEAAYFMIDGEDNQTVTDLRGFGGGVFPNHGKVTSMYDVGGNYIPFYAKMSVLGHKIIYFDMVFSPKIGMIEYEQQLDSGNKSQSAFTYGFDISQMFFLNEHLTIRVDLKNRWFTEKRKQWLKSSGDPNVHESVGDTFNNTTLFSIGVQYFF